jgi:hypothetical protein
MATRATILGTTFILQDTTVSRQTIVGPVLLTVVASVPPPPTSSAQPVVFIAT